MAIKTELHLDTQNTAVAWLDIETTSLKPMEGGIVELAIILVNKNKYIDELNILMAPDNTDFIAGEALAIQNRSLEEVRNYPSKEIGFKQFVNFFEKYKHLLSQQNNKFYMAGHNIVHFDLNYLYQWTKRKFNLDIYSLFFNKKPLDTLIFCREYMDWQPNNAPANRKLVTLIDFFNIQSDTAHIAINDVQANIQVFNHLLKYKKRYADNGKVKNKV